MLRRHSWNVIVLLLVFVALVVINVWFKLFAFHPFASHERWDFKVFCLNIHSTGDDFVERSLRIDSLIQAEDPDFVFLTEYQDTCSMMLDSLLRVRYQYYEQGFYGQYILTERVYCRWPIDSIRNLHIDINNKNVQDYLEKNQHAKWHVGLSAIFRWKVNINGSCVSIYTCHLSSNNYLNEIDSSRYSWPNPLRSIEQRLLAYKDGSKLREFEVETIRQSIDGEEVPVIVMGDMNDFPFSNALNRLKSIGLQDAWWDKGFGVGNTFMYGPIGARIDYVLHNDRISTCGMRVHDENLSDHNALVTSFQMR